MERVGVLVVSYGAREAAMIDAFHRTREYGIELYVIDKQRNPFNATRATEHIIVPDLDVIQISKFALKRTSKIDFGIVGPEKPIINGLRDIVEQNTNIPIICPTKEFAIEASKVAQRRIFEEAAAEVNPRFRVFSPDDYKDHNSARKALYSWLNELENQAVVKPDTPAAGKGVGVWGDHFNNREELFDHFLANLQHGKVIVEEKIDGEESSFQAFCDGKHLVALPETRDYKRAFDGDKGPNTGGMGSYKNYDALLPFMSPEDREKEKEIVEKIFRVMKRRAINDELRGFPFYVAFIHSAKGLKILENNSRPGDPEIINVLPLLKDDFVEVCFKIIEGNLNKVEIQKDASVVIYKAPPSYGGYQHEFPERVVREEIGTPIQLEKAYKLCKESKDRIRVYPASMETRAGLDYALTSRTVAVVGIADNIETARNLSFKGVNAIGGGALWSRSDIASNAHIEKSVKHMEAMRRRNR